MPDMDDEFTNAGTSISDCFGLILGAIKFIYCNAPGSR